MKTRRLDFKFTPLQLSVSMTLEGSVPNEQTYDADSGEYAPDYSLTPAVIKPTVGIIDRDGILQSGCVNSQLTDVSWCRVVDGVEQTTLVNATNQQIITFSGDDTGKILWYQNAQPQKPITLRFKAKFLDIRTGEVRNITQDFPFTCRNATLYKPVLLLSCGDRFYNPLRDESLATVTASLRLGTEECAKAKRKFAWQMLRNTGYYTDITDDDLEVSVSADGDSITIDQSLMGERCSLRCRARYSATGNPSAVALTDASPTKVITFARRIPSFDYDYMGVTDNLPPGTTSIQPEAYIYDNAGKIPDAERNLLPLWYMGANLSATKIDYRLKGHGMQPTIKTDLVDPSRGAVMALDVKILDPLALAADADGKVFTDANGTPFVWH